MMNILCAGLGLVCAGLAVSVVKLCKSNKELKDRVSHCYDRLDMEYDYAAEKEIEIAKLNDYIECLQKQCNEYVSEHLTSVANLVTENVDIDDQIGIHFVSDDKDFNSGISWNLDEESNTIGESHIYVNTVEHFNEQSLWMIDYLNKEFGVNLRKDAKTIYTFTLLHEIGHYVDYMNQKDLISYRINNSESYAMVNSIAYSEEQWLAYRQITSEYNADKFAIEFMIKHYPELVYSNDDSEVAKLKAVMNIALEEGNFDAYDEAEQKLNELNK